MRTSASLNYLCLLFLVSTISPFCINAQSTHSLSADQKSVLVKEIMEFTDNWARNNMNRDADKVIEFWSESPDLRFAENGIFFTNLDSIHSFLKGFYANTKAMEVEWKERFVLPIKEDVACLSGFFRFRATFNSGEIFEGVNAFTAVFTKKEGKWSVINGHESAVPKE